MGSPRLSEKDFAELFEKLGVAEMSRQTGIAQRNIHARRKTIEAKLGRTLVSPHGTQRTKLVEKEHPHRVMLKVYDGVVLVGSDAHVWPGPPTPAWRAFVHFAKKLDPKVIVMNGDAFDGASVSRHPPIGWASLPSVQQEIEACQERLGEIEMAKPAKCKLVWPLGNHDSRYETRLATVAPEYAKVHGTSLQDHFPAWKPCWAAWINDGNVVVKHRWKSGVHGVYNNTVNAGATMITGHDHALRVSPFSDYAGTRWGVSSGTLADPYGPQFLDYTEDNPRSHRAGFIVLTFREGRLLWPEIVDVVDEDHVSFRGEIIQI